MNRLSQVKNFFLPLSKNVYQNHGLTHISFAFYCYILAFSNVYSFPKDIITQYGEIYIYLYLPTLIFSTILITHPIWQFHTQNVNFIPVIWYVSIFYNLIFVSTAYIILSDFRPIQLIIFISGIILTTVVLRWQLAALMICGGTILAYQFCIIYLSNFSTINVQNVYSKAIYCLILIIATLVIFLKPRHEAQERSEEMVDHLSHELEDKNNQIIDLSNLKQTFLRNLQHETNTPLTGVYSMSQALGDCYDKLDDSQRKGAIDTITKNSERLISYVHNMVDISKLMNNNFELNLRNVDLSRLLEDSLRKCKRLYVTKEAEDDQEITLNIEPNIKVKCDEYLIKRSFENLIINAIQYCKKGQINISLNNIEGRVVLKVKDTGLGIPPKDLNLIFEPFVTSSKTTTPAGGRGLGLSLVKAAAEAHGGTITAESYNKPGFTCSIFTLTLAA